MESEFSLELQAETHKVLKSNDPTLMECFFSHLFSSPQENQHRSKAFTFLQCSKHHHPELLTIKLVFLLAASPDPNTRANAARVLLLVKPSELWPKLLPQAQAHLQTTLINYLTQETSINVLRIASPVLAQTVSVIYQSHQHWPQILDLLLSSVKSNDEKLREFALLVFASLPNDCRLLISNSLQARDAGAVRLLHSSFLSSLASRNPDVQVASFGAVLSLVRLFYDPSLFHELLRAMMIAVFALVHGNERSYFRSAFAELVKLVSSEPVLLKPYLSDMVLDVLQISENNGLCDETHRLAFELVLVMIELKECEEVLANLPHQTVVRLFCVPMRMLQKCVESEEEEEEGYRNENKVDDVYGFGMKCLKKLCVGLGGDKVVPVAYELLLIYLDGTDWKTRHAGITLLTVIATDFSDEMVLMENILGELVTKVLKLFQDPQVQVRLAAFTLMEMPINFVQAVQILYHHRFVPAFSMALGSDEDNKVKEKAASAMLFFLKNTLPESLAFYHNADIVMGKFLSLLQDKESTKQRSIALSTFNIVAQNCHEVAHKYCANYLSILLEACNDEKSEIKEEAARGIRICAEFGSPHFKPFVSRIFSELSTLIKDRNRSLSENGKAYDVAVSALGRICEFHRDSIDGSQVVPAWLSYLPLKDDLVEAKIMHEQLCLMVARLDKDLLGAGNQNIVKIIMVFLEVIDKGDKLATAQTINQMYNLLRQLGQHIPRSAFDTILLSLNAQQRELLLPLVSS